MKSGWQMEWDMQVRYAAPMRSRLALMTQALQPMREVFVTLAATAAPALASLRRVAEQLEALR